MVNVSTIPNLLQEAELTVQNHSSCYLQEKNFFSKNLEPGVNFCAGKPGASI